MKVITKRLQRAFRKYDIAQYAKAGFTIKSAVVSPKDHLDLGDQCEIIYECACDICG